ncbi:MAG: FtsX-like permease family protein [Candidatus Saccharicenans sp.]|nr:FtsX-like permease family protein [Candidatus Saccharicenans sp.]
MISFIIKGILRDRSRSLFPALIVAAGAMLTVFFYSYMQGGKNNFIETSARYQTGHLKVMTRAYAAESDLLPNDLALTGATGLVSNLRAEYPELIWKPRIRFAGLLDIPDENGQTRAQGPISGLAVELVADNRNENQNHRNLPEAEILNLKKGLIAGRLPEKPREILVGSVLASSLKINPGDRATIISSTLTGAMAIADFTVAGVIRFGVTPLDKTLVIADLEEARQLLDMEDAAGEIFGFYPDFLYRPQLAARMARDFNAKSEERARSSGEDPDFLPLILTLGEQGGLGDMIAIYDVYAYVLVAVFVAVMSLVLWNAGLMGSLRRYGEIGLRLAMGETHRRLYFSLLGESVIIGLIGSVAGTALGLAISYYLQTYGINAEAFTRTSEMMMTNIIKAQVTRVSYIIGFIPGLLATLLGTAMAGLGIFRRRTATLMKEFEA